MVAITRKWDGTNVTPDPVPVHPLTKDRAIVTTFRGRSRSLRRKYGSQLGP